MLGFFVGAVGVVVLARVARRARWRRHGMHGAWAHGLRRLFRRLGTTPVQERVILAEVEKLREAGRAMREEAVRARADAAGFLRKDDLAGLPWDEVMGRHERAAGAMREAVKDAFTAIHAALEPAQRERLAAFLDGLPASPRTT
jgi:hypothetical protein